MNPARGTQRDGLPVTGVSKVYERFRRLIHEAAKFGVVGAVALALTEAGTNLLHFQAGLGPVVSNLIASLVATVASYTGNRYWTFRHREGSSMPREYLLYMVLNGLGIVIQLACVWFGYYHLGLHGKLGYNVALVAGIALGTLFRFWS